MNKLSAFILFLIIVFGIGCGVSEKKIKHAEERINILSQKGVPDSALSRARVFLYQAKDAKKRGNVGLARMSVDSLMILIAKAESDYEENMKKLKPSLSALMSELKKESADLKGLHKKSADSLIAIFDSLYQSNQLYKAEKAGKDAENAIKLLKLGQEKANEIKPKVPGVWKAVQITKHSEDKTVHAVEEKIFDFRKNGTAILTEQKKGKSTPYFKEDWKFISYGKWDVKSDTIFMFVNRFKVAKQNFWDLKEKNGKKVWVKNPAPTYDSTITDGSQDRFIIYSDLLEDFKKIKSY